MKRAFFIVCLWAAAGCGGDDKDRDPVTSETVSMGEICDAFGEITCDWIADCGQEVPNCEQEFRNACCTGAACNEEVTGVIGDWRSCYEDVLADAGCDGDFDPDALAACGD